MEVFGKIYQRLNQYKHSKNYKEQNPPEEEHLWNRYILGFLKNRISKDINNDNEIETKYNDFIKKYKIPSNIVPMNDEEVNKIRNYFESTNNNIDYRDIKDFSDSALDIETIKIDSDFYKYIGNFENLIFPLDVEFITDFSEIKLRQINIIDTKSFKNTIFLKRVRTNNAKFQNANFENAQFYGDVNFDNVEFLKDTNFKNAKFYGNVNFNGTTFEEITCFEKIDFNEEANFHSVRFKDNLYFTGSTFFKTVDFQRVRFEKNTYFSKATFKHNTIFTDARFFGDVSHFITTKFEKDVDFSHAVFKNKVNFSEAEFKELPKLTGIEARGGIDLNKTLLPKNALGGLHSEDAQNTWHIFYKTMQDEQRFDKVSEYFSYYNDARLQDATISCPEKFVLILYKWLSSYGASIFRPIISLLVSVLVFSIIYSWIIFGINLENKPFDDINSYINKHSLYLSAQNIFPFITDNVVLLDKIFDPKSVSKEENQASKETFLQMADLTIKNIPEEKQKYLWLLFPVRMIQFLFSTLCLFLFGLGVRNFLRLK